MKLNLRNIFYLIVSLVQLSQKLEQLVNQTGGEVLKAILEQADEAIYTGVNQEILKNEWSRRKLPYCTYVPDKASHMPGRESTSTGEWMRLIENGGYQHIM